MSIYLFPIRRSAVGEKNLSELFRRVNYCDEALVKFESDQAAHGVEIGSVATFSLVACCYLQAGPFENYRARGQGGAQRQVGAKSRLLALHVVLPTLLELVATGLLDLESEINQIPWHEQKNQRAGIAKC